MQLINVFAAVGYGATLALAAPQHGPARSFLTPRQSNLNWNVPRSDEGGFLAKRDNTHSVEFFNRKRAVSLPSSGDEGHANFRAYVASMKKRATSGRWESLNGTMASYPSACSYGGKNMGVYYKSKEKTCQYKSYDGNKWSGWQDLGGSCDSPPVTCSYADGYQDVYVKGTDGGCWKKSYSDQKWGSWESLGGDMVYEPSVCTYGKEVHTYASSKDGQCYYKKYSATSKNYTSWESIGGYLDGPPKAVTWGSDHQSVVCKGEDGAAWHKKKTGNSWGDWESLGGDVAEPPAACAWNKRVEIFVKGNDGACWTKSYQNDKWSSWKNMGGDLAYAPEVVQYDYGGSPKMEVYATYNDGGVYRRTWYQETWTSSWEYMGGAVASKPCGVYYNGNAEVYGWGKDGTCKRCY